MEPLVRHYEVADRLLPDPTAKDTAPIRRAKR
jgi:hypothetical protein